MKLNGPHKNRFVVLFAIACCVARSPEGFAQTAAGPGAATPTSIAKSSSKGLARVISGVKSYKAAKIDKAISSLSLALSAGGLSSKDMAKALYYRGLAYRRKAKPGEAIADLTSAVWLKNGLNETERQDALKNRSEAYREAGISDPGLPTSVTAAGRGGPAPAPAPSTSGATGWKTATQSKTGAQSPVRSGLAPDTGTASPSPGSSTTSSSGPLSSVGGFFSNLFGGGGSSSSSGNAAKSPAAQPAKSAGGLPPGIGVPGGTPGAANPTLTTPSPGPVSAVSGWSSATQVAKKTTKKTVVAKAAVTSRPAAPPAVVAKGKYKVRLAAVRSRDEATKII